MARPVRRSLRSAGVGGDSRGPNPATKDAPQRTFFRIDLAVALAARPQVGVPLEFPRGLVLLSAVTSAPATGTPALIALVLLMLVAGATHIRMRAARKSVRVGA